MANPTQGRSSSILPVSGRQAPQQAVLLWAAPQFVSKCGLHVLHHGRRKPPRRSFACSASRLPSTEPPYVEEMLARENIRTRNTERKARIQKHLGKPEFSPSAYDTAWVAMVPLPDTDRQAPCFPQCVEWILQNQHCSGSWGINQFGLLANKDILLSTLACIIALKKWNVGSDHISRGLEFIGRNISTVMDKQIVSPIGFNLIFPGMFNHAIRMGLECPVRETDISGILHLCEMELRRLAGEESNGKEAYLAFVAEEGLVSLLDRNEVMNFQRKNGSLFNSPAATAAVLVHRYDDKALQYLNSIVSIFGRTVPTVYPQNIYYQLSMVDMLEKIGISRHFSSEINSILDKAYISWLQRDEEIIQDVETCAMAFRLLRMNGYDVSSDELSHVSQASTFHDSLEGYLNQTKSLLELYKASKLCLSENELILENISNWSGRLLTEKLCCSGTKRTPILGEVEYTLKFPFYATVETLDRKRNIEHFDSRVSQQLKTKNLLCHVNQDILDFAIEDFSISQSIYQDELRHLERWEKENRLHQLRFLRKGSLINCYLSAAATISAHEFSDARIACAKAIALVLVTDDFFDVGASKEEQENLIALVEKWDHHHKVEFYSEQVEVVFSAFYTTVNQLGEMASAVQNCDVTKHLDETWLHYMRSVATEAKWQRNQYVPTVEEYMTDALTSYGMGPIMLTSLYFVQNKLMKHIIKDPEYSELLRLMGTCGRLLNDTQGFERESRDGKLNIISLLVLQSGGSMSIEAAQEATQESVASCRRDLLRMVVREDRVVPRPCKEVFWRFCKTAHLFYCHTDGFSSPKEMLHAMNAIFREPLKLQTSSPLAVQSEK
ncbi:9-beta-pimara-7,15-diene synthase, chloroplastic [Aegilops tauschii subsp. strangulata]|uniref:Syn-pimara-7,15-diene synthase n=1 Tax=Aegilops tauschii subsp. strangulata TaxID=200361 RepID=A0A453AAD7_AEGTS|nr:9-beta-pimara-7,15-diene synthase, chloroplastic [Aegilops tauschii subsp. strangulata]